MTTATLTLPEVVRIYGHGPRSAKPDSKGRHRINCPVHGGDGQNCLVWENEKGHIMFSCETAGCRSSDIADAVFGPPPKEKGALAGALNTTPTGFLEPVDESALTTDHGKGKKHIPQLTSAEIEGPWYYHDASGKKSIRVTRRDNPPGSEKAKDFFPSGRKGSNWQTRGALPSPRPMYNLPTVMASTLPVLIVEGEKACHGAMHVTEGYVCTTWCGGKGAWQLTDWTPIAGRKVYIWPDKDALAEAKALAVKLHSLGCSVYIVDVSSVPNGYDLANPIENVNGLLEAAVPYAAEVVDLPEAKSPFQIIRSTDLMKTVYPETKWVAADFIPEGVTMLAAPPKIGKSFFCELLAACVATGRPFLGLDTSKTKTLYIDAEQSPRLIQKRLKALNWEQGAEDLDFISMPGVMLDKKTLETVLTPIIKAGGYGLIVLDTMARLLPRPKGGGDGYQNASEMIGPFHEWCHSLGISALVIHHTKKGETPEGGESHDAITGGYGFAAVVDTVITFKRSDKTLFKVSVTGRIEEARTYAIEKAGALWVMRGDFEEQSATEERREILEAMRELGGNNLKASEIADEVGKDRNLTGKLLVKMSKGEAPLVIQKGKPQHYRYSLPE